MGAMDRGKRPREGIAEYDFHGMRAVDAERRLRALIEQGGKRGLRELRIVHGKGEGVLADVVARVGRSHPQVAHVQRGFLNDGVTTIELRR
jgi:DNA-nicking Smr family endonuclease